MQVFGNVATKPERKKSKTTGKDYFEFRLAESQRGADSEPTWYSVRVMRDADLALDKGDFVKVTGKLKVDFYLSREGKPTGTLLIIAFEAAKIAKPASVTRDAAAGSATRGACIFGTATRGGVVLFTRSNARRAPSNNGFGVGMAQAIAGDFIASSEAPQPRQLIHAGCTGDPPFGQRMGNPPRAWHR